jgi:hypothetical protein
MARVILPQLAIVITSHAVYRSDYVILLLATIMSHYDGMVVAAGHIYDLRVS